jgi:aspartate-semialdehyde dehydrogenase
MLIEVEKLSTVNELEAALAGDHIDVLTGESDPPSNLSAAGQEEILVRVRKDSNDSNDAARFWIWMAADNLKLAALNSIACATELRRLRPSGKVQ